MRNPSFDPGLTQQVIAPLRRIIKKDGSFNVHRHGTTWRDIHPYLHLVNMSWPRFLVTLFLGYIVINTLFAGVYFALGPDQLTGADAPTAWGRFLNEFFFSSHTLSTVGYGNISPKSVSANVVATFEALVGVLGFAVATGLLFGRVSRPSARIGFSENVLIAPYQDGAGLQFRVVNRRANSLMELEVKLMLMTVEPRNGRPERAYKLLALERSQVLFLPLTWTVVHPIDSESPLWGKTAEDLERLQAELLILIKGFDDTFNQTVLSRHSYRHDEIVWNKRFAPAFFVDDEGDLVLEVRKVGEIAVPTDA
ncbi:MAG TPA: ion channel [Bryobacteraceae bacterium]|nr:ion channel [Bryobacteraceae bacterium]